MQARLTGAGHMLHISQVLRAVPGPAGDWRWWVLDQDGRRVGEFVLMGNRPLHEFPTESEMKQAYGCAIQRIGASRWNIFAFDDLRWSD